MKENKTVKLKRREHFYFKDIALTQKRNEIIYILFMIYYIYKSMIENVFLLHIK